MQWLVATVLVATFLYIDITFSFIKTIFLTAGYPYTASLVTNAVGKVGVIAFGTTNFNTNIYWFQLDTRTWSSLGGTSVLPMPMTAYTAGDIN